MQNVLTDLKAWMAPLQPETRRRGKLCKVRPGLCASDQGIQDARASSRGSARDMAGHPV